MDTEVFTFCDETELLSSLLDATFLLLKKTKNIAPIKKLLEVYDILDVNTQILQKYKGGDLTFDEIWLDTATLRYLNRLRCELFIYHRKDFEYPRDFDGYNILFSRFLNLVILRLKNGFDVENLELIIY